MCPSSANAPCTARAPGTVYKRIAPVVREPAVVKVSKVSAATGASKPGTGAGSRSRDHDPRDHDGSMHSSHTRAITDSRESNDRKNTNRALERKYVEYRRIHGMKHPDDPTRTGLDDDDMSPGAGARR